jgi:seryl-tRNA synthetase
MEQYQEEDGRVRIPEKLSRWFDGQTHLEKTNW